MGYVPAASLDSLDFEVVAMLNRAVVPYLYEAAEHGGPWTWCPRWALDLAVACGDAGVGSFAFDGAVLSVMALPPDAREEAARRLCAAVRLGGLEELEAVCGSAAGTYQAPVTASPTPPRRRRRRTRWV